MYNLYMIFAFVILIGIGLLFHSLLAIRPMESMVISAACLTAFMAMGGYVNHFFLGIMASILASLAGILLYAFLRVTKRKKRSFFDNPAIILLIILYLFGLVMFKSAEVHIFDELHHWAPAIRYMNEHNTIHFQEDFIGYPASQYYGITIFCVFFQKLVGYSEPAMYQAVYLLCLLGFLLPLSSFGRKQWKEAVLYTITIFLAVYSLYNFGIYNIYTDLPTAAWAGGLAGWWYGRKKQKRNIVLIITALLTIFFFKIMVGAVLVCSVLLLFLLDFLEDYVQAGTEKAKSKIYGICQWINAYKVAILLVGLALLLLLFAEECINHHSILWNRLILLQGSQESAYDRIHLTFGAFWSEIFGKSVTYTSEMMIPFIPGMIFLCIAYGLFGKLCLKKKLTTEIVYMICIGTGYSIVLFLAYLLIFTYEESIEVTCMYRYLSIPLIYFVMIFLARIYQTYGRRKEQRKISYFFLLFPLLYFSLGINDNFIANMTAFDNASTTGAAVRSDILEEYQKFEDQLGDSKVYLVDQRAKEYAACIMIYRYENKVNNYLWTPWAFTENGAYTFNAARPNLSIKDLPVYLLGYDYLWIHHTDPYLSQVLPEIILDYDEENPLELSNGQLFRITYNDGEKIQLELVGDYHEI